MTGLNVLKIGSGGNPLIMLHGWGHSINEMRPLGELLSAGHPVHTVEFPGFGQSPVPKEVWGTKDYAERILEYLDEQGIRATDLLGHSFGGRVSIQLATLRPDRVKHLVLINTAG